MNNQEKLLLKHAEKQKVIPGSGARARAISGPAADRMKKRQEILQGSAAQSGAVCKVQCFISPNRRKIALPNLIEGRCQCIVL
jgi:hypothetical protein